MSDTSEPEGVDAFSSFTEERLSHILEVAKAIEGMGGNTKLISLCDMVGGNALEKIRLAQKSGVVTTFESFDDAVRKKVRWFTVNPTKLSVARRALKADPGTTKEDETMAVGAEKCKGPVTLLHIMRGLSPDNSLMEKDPLVDALVGKREYMGWKQAEARQRANVLIGNNVANGKVTKTATGQLKISAEGRKYLEEKLAEYPELAISEAAGDDKGATDDLDELAKQAGELVKSEKIPECMIFDPDAIKALAEQLSISKARSEKVWRKAEELKLIEIANDEGGDTLIWLPEGKGDGDDEEEEKRKHNAEYVEELFNDLKVESGISKDDLVDHVVSDHKNMVRDDALSIVDDAITEDVIRVVDNKVYPAGEEPKKPTTTSPTTGKGITYTDSALGVDVSFTKDVDLRVEDREFTVGVPDSVNGDVLKIRFENGIPTVGQDEIEISHREDGLSIKHVSE